MVRDMNTETIDDGGPASEKTLRDWFAGREALSDYDHPDSWKHYSLVLEAVNGPSPDSVADTLGYFKWECEGRAKMKLMRADAMLSARKGASK